jgi:hypothetical protein
VQKREKMIDMFIILHAFSYSIAQDKFELKTAALS